MKQTVPSTRPASDEEFVRAVRASTAYLKRYSEIRTPEVIAWEKLLRQTVFPGDPKHTNGEYIHLYLTCPPGRSVRSIGVMVNSAEQLIVIMKQYRCSPESFAPLHRDDPEEESNGE